MKQRTFVLTFLTFFFALSASAAQTKLFARYETVRQSMIKASIADIQTSAKELAATARAEKQEKVAASAETLAKSTSVKAARESFALVSNEVIAFRDALSGERPVVVYCSMEKKSWLQPAGAIGNPYADASMRACGSIRKDK